MINGGEKINKILCVNKFYSFKVDLYSDKLAVRKDSSGLPVFLFSELFLCIGLTISVSFVVQSDIKRMKGKTYKK